MVKGGTDNVQQGIFMDNGSGGFYSDLVFNGGNYGMFVGNQQFTTRNLTFNGCGTAVFMNWNWVWNLKSITVNNVSLPFVVTPSFETAFRVAGRRKNSILPPIILPKRTLFFHSLSMNDMLTPKCLVRRRREYVSDKPGKPDRGLRPRPRQQVCRNAKGYNYSLQHEWQCANHR